MFSIRGYEVWERPFPPQAITQNNKIANAAKLGKLGAWHFISPETRSFRGNAEIRQVREAYIDGDETITFIRRRE